MLQTKKVSDLCVPARFTTHASNMPRLVEAGKAARQRAIVQGRITDGIMFPTICALISDRMHGTLQKTRRELLEMMAAVMGHIRTDLTYALGDKNSNERQTCLNMESADMVTLREALPKVKHLKLDAKDLFAMKN